jgi:hypothetical protein
MIRKIAHIINPVRVAPASALFIAQPIAFESMSMARAFARDQVEVELFSAQYSEDRALVPADFQMTPDLTRSILDLGFFQKEQKLPLLGDILERLYKASNAEYFIYTGADIVLLPQFYVAVNAFIAGGYDAFVVNSRSIPADYQSPAEIALMYAEVGEKQERQDCFVFRRESCAKYKLGAICLGAPLMERVFIWNLIYHARQFKEFKNFHLTFHIGKRAIGEQKEYFDYWAHNQNEATKIRSDIEKEYGSLNELSPFARYPLELNVVDNDAVK